MEDSVNHPPAFIVADSHEDLRMVMIANNRRHARRFSYFDIQEMRDGRWIAWFEIPVRDLEGKELENADQ